MKRYYRIWKILTGNAVQTSFATRLNASVLVAGKLFRFGFFLFFLTIISTKIQAVGGYSLIQIIFFYLTYQLVDTIPQMLLREVYKFRGYVVKGDFDYFLAKPLSPLFRALFGGPDILDVPVAVISFIAILFISTRLPSFSITNVLWYVALLINALIIAVAFHILVISMGVVTTEVDNAIMLYRDTTQMGRIPTDIYRQPLQGILTFVVPVGIMMTIPAKAMMGLLNPLFIILAFAISMLLLFLSIRIWQNALKHYSSASS